MNQLVSSRASTVPAHADSRRIPDPATEYLTFRVGEVNYALDILRVQEIRSFEPPTPLPNAPPGIAGVINLRGEVVPVVDLREHLGNSASRPDASTVVIVTAWQRQVVGWIVDAVSDVIELNEQDLRPVPDYCAAVGNQNIERIALLPHADGERLVVLLDLQALMRSSSLQRMPESLDALAMS